MRFIIVFTLFYLWFTPVSAQESLPDFSSLKHTKSGRVDKVIDALTILLKDGTIVRLSAIDVPDKHLNDALFAPVAMTYLQQQLPNGTEVKLYQSRMAKKGRVNRMGHSLAQIVTKPRPSEEQEPLWLQAEMLKQGFARVQFIPEQEDLAEELYAAENIAIKDNIGLWNSDSVLRIKSPDDVGVGDYEVVEGTVLKAASMRNNLFLNFGKDWKTDFTVMVSTSLRKKMAHRGLDPQSLSGQKVRVRGWVRDYNGPLIELDTPVHLQIIE